MRAAVPSTPVLVYDGDCAFCTAAARWARRGWPGEAGAGTAAEAVPWQELDESGLELLGLTVRQAERAAWWIDGTGECFRAHRAIGHALLASVSGWRRAVGHLVLTAPTSWLAAAVYWVVVRYRHRLPGATPACRSVG